MTREVTVVLFWVLQRAAKFFDMRKAVEYGWVEPEDSEEREEVGDDTEDAEDIVILLAALDVLLAVLLVALDVLLAASSFLFLRARVLVACLFRFSR